MAKKVTKTISIKLKKGGDTLKFPVNPENVKVQIGATYVSFKTISGGDYKIPTGKTIKSVSWKGVFLAKAHEKNPIIQKGASTDTDALVQKIDKWMTDKAKLKLVIGGSFVNIDCSVSKFYPNLTGAYGDYEYQITCDEYKSLKIYTTAELNPGKDSKDSSGKKQPQKTKEREEPAKKADYTIKYGDTLWALCRKYYGKSSPDNVAKIYEANKEVMDAEARKHGFRDANKGNYLWPGTKLVIPS